MAHRALFLRYRIHRKKYEANLKIISSTFRGLVPSTSADNESKWRNDSPRTMVQRYLIFAPVSSVPDAARVILKFHKNKKNSSGFPSSKKSILNSLRSNKYDVGYLYNLSLTEYLSELSSLLLWIRGARRGSICICVIPEVQDFLWETLFIVKWSVGVRLCQAIYLKSFICPIY